MGTRSAESEIKLVFNSTISNLLPDNRTATCQINEQVKTGKILNGVSANQANRAWENKAIEISSGNTLDIDLYDFGGQDIGAGSGNDGLGQAIALEEIVCLVIKQTGGTGRVEIMPTEPSNSLTWIPGGYATVSNGGALRVGGIRMWLETDESALDVIDATSHVLRLGANGGDVVVDVWVLGRHDDNESSSSQSTSTQSNSSTSTGSSTSTASSLSSSST